jgi:hypothetical protein
MNGYAAQLVTTGGTVGGKVMFLLFAWLISGAAGAGIAARKGYSERLGLTLGLLLSVVGLLIVLLLPGRPDSKWRVEGWWPRRRRRIEPTGAESPGDGGDPA